jgi:Dehydrogenase E1 component
MRISGRTPRLRGAVASPGRGRAVRAVAVDMEFAAVNHQEMPFSADLDKLEMDSDVARALYKDMRLGRDFEEMCAQMYYRGKMFGFVHLYSGQEAVSTGVIGCLTKADYVCRCAAAHRWAHCAGSGHAAGVVPPPLRHTRAPAMQAEQRLGACLTRCAW